MTTFPPKTLADRQTLATTGVTVKHFIALR